MNNAWMTPTIITMSAVFTRSVIKRLKAKNWLPGGEWTLIISFLINFVILLGWAFVDGAELNITFVRGILSALIAAFYNDIKEPNEPAPAPQFSPQDTQDA